ncbi:MAG: ferrous iron transport protein B [Candidatus Sumerlaeota bacterium]|nr:ferrous iron transport protein B [Candidatus Sumerlaeota bacterium]
MIRVAIAGNPNAGKSSIFNNLTGASQHVGNYPGVTVERMEGEARFEGRVFSFVDLPGTYSLTAFSQDEIVARDFVVDEKPDVVVDVVDASNLERNLYLAVQLMEMRAPLVIALNMMDAARKRGYQINVKKLSRLMGVPVVPCVASKGEGMKELLEACAAVAESRLPSHAAEITYGHEVDEAMDSLAEPIAGIAAIAEQYPPRWIAAKLAEGDEQIQARVRTLAGEAFGAIDAAVRRSVQAIEKHFDDTAATIIAERRYGYAAGAVKECVTLTGEARQDATDHIDMIVCHRVLGPAILVGVVAAMFFCVFKVSDEWKWIPWRGGAQSPTGLVEWGFDWLAQSIAWLKPLSPLAHSLFKDAVIAGVGGVLGFVPLIFCMFLFIAALEDSGYIARVAFIMDRALRIFGLQGKSILALFVSGGFGAGGCAAAGIMATRTLREEKDRLVTMLVAPFLNCGAKIPVYAMLIAAFFSGRRTEVMLMLWVVSWFMTLIAALGLRKFVIRGEQTPFVMELPPYHLPTLRGLWRHAWERTWLYVKKAGTIILAINIVVWAFMTFPNPPLGTRNSELGTRNSELSRTAAARLEYSFAGRVGRFLEPVTKAAGFDWRTNIALMGGLAAKELVLSTMATAYAMGEVKSENSQSLSQKLAGDPQWSRLKALTLMLFVMLYAPCVVTLSVIRRESGSWKWSAFSLLYSTGIAFVFAVIVYQTGRALGF